MRAFTFRQYIDRPPARVWEVLTDLSQVPRWRPLVKSMSTEDGKPIRVGSRIRWEIQYLGRDETRVLTTSEFEPERRWVQRSTDQAPVEGILAITLEPMGRGTLVEATYDLIAHRALPWLFLPLIARGERQRRVDLLKNLKRLVEADRQPA